VVANVISERPLEVFRLENDHGGLASVEGRSWGSPWPFSTTEGVVAAGTGEASGEDTIAFGVAGGGEVKRIDVYELGK
jgi:hypothetical protein